MSPPARSPRVRPAGPRTTAPRRRRRMGPASGWTSAREPLRSHPQPMSADSTATAHAQTPDDRGRRRDAGVGRRDDEPCPGPRRDRRQREPQVGHQGATLSASPAKTGVADARDIEQLLGAREGPIGVAPVDDALRERRSDARQRVEFGDIGRIEVHESVGGRRGSDGPRRGRNRTDDRHRQLLAVDHRSREIHPRRIGFGRESAGCGDGVDDPSAGLELDEPGRDTAPSMCTSSGAPETAPSPEASSTPASLPTSPAIGPPMVPCAPPPVAANDRMAATATAPMNSATAAPTVTRSRGDALRALGSSAPNGSGRGSAGIPAR